MLKEFMKKNILILGSKPNATIPDSFDIVYCANTSGYLYKKQLNLHKATFITMVAASELVKSPARISNEKKKWQLNRINTLKKLCDHNFIIVSLEHFPDAAETILDFDEIKNISYQKHSRYESFLKEYLIYPVFSNLHYDSLFDLPKALVKYLLDCYRYKLNDNYLVNSLYRPSTGIICLIEAIIMNGHNSIYNISGIGFESRGLYEDGTSNTWTPVEKIKKNHVLVDKKLINILSKEYEINII